jgi:hypothetical protein
MSSQYTLTVDNKQIYEFYEKNNLDFEVTNLLFVQLLDTVLQTADITNNKSIIHQVLTECLNGNRKLDTISSDIANVHASLIKTQGELVVKLFEVKSDFIHDMKSITSLENNSLFEKIKETIQNNQHDKIQSLFQSFLSEVVERLIDKINLLLKETLPENNLAIQKEINTFQTSLMEDVTKNIPIQDILKSLNEVSTKNDLVLGNVNRLIFANTSSQLESFLSSFDGRYSQLMTNIQQPLSCSIKEIQDTVSKQVSTQERVDEFLNKFRQNSSIKGRWSENHLKEILESIDGSEVLDTSKITSSCDLLLNRVGKESILIENKEYEFTVPKNEVDKFCYDCNFQKKHGIFLSQSSNIALKTDYTIEIYNGTVILMYIGNVNYDFDKIKICLDVIDHLSGHLKRNTKSDDDFTIPMEALKEINEEYLSVIKQKECAINLCKDFHKKITKSIEDISLPSLEKFFNVSVPSTQPKNNTYQCNFCNSYIGKSKQALSAHHRGCTMNPKSKSSKNISPKNGDEM